MSTLEFAIELAAKSHAGQKDKGGKPYILHPLRVMAAVGHHDEKIVAVLHDVVEDTGVNLAMLKSFGFSARVIAAVDALTKRPGESRLDAAKRAHVNALARTVKLADVADNMDVSRLHSVSEKDLARLNEYFEVRNYLLWGNYQHE